MWQYKSTNFVTNLTSQKIVVSTEQIRHVMFYELRKENNVTEAIWNMFYKEILSVKKFAKYDLKDLEKGTSEMYYEQIIFLGLMTCFCLTVIEILLLWSKNKLNTQIQAMQQLGRTCQPFWD